MNITINQALNLWSQLAKCLLHSNTYSSDTAEIYIYTLMEYSPHYANNPDGIFALEDRQKAINVLIDLCTRFEKEFSCVILIQEHSCRLVDASHSAVDYPARIHLQVIDADEYERSMFSFNPNIFEDTNEANNQGKEKKNQTGSS
jgi:hypothetical protein